MHITTETKCYAAAVDELPGGTAEDYSTHIIETIDNLASVHSYFYNGDYQDTRSKIIDNISNTLTDRCAANHAAILLVNESWDKTLNELNCHLHPLDSIAIKTRSALKECEDALALKKLWGNDCSAGNIVMAMNKLRYKDGKGDPRGFVTFLDNQKLPRGILPRYRGNRLHILFHICGVFIQHYTVFMKFLEKGTSCGGLRASLLSDFRSTTGHVQMQVLGLLGKLLTGPWMKKFYRAAVNQIDHVEAIYVVKEVVTRLKEQRSPLDLLTQSNDFFGDALKDSDETLQKLRDPPKDEDLFKVMMEACLGAIVEVLERQYKKYFEIDLTEKLKEETKSARTHNIDAEEIMGMFSASKKRSPNATLCFLSCKMRAQKNKTVGFLEDLDTEKRDAILKKAVKLGQVQRQRRRVKQNDLREELSKRQAMKEQAKEITARNKLERKLKNIQIKDLEEKFPELEKPKLEKITELLSGKAVGRNMCHVWCEEGKRIVYNGRIVKMKAKGKRCVVAYWGEDESYEDATDFDMSVFALAADLIADDLTI